MQKNPKITTQRIEQFLKEFLSPRLWQHKIPLQIEMHYMGVEQYTYRKPSELIAANAPWKQMAQGEKWGPVWSTAWFKYSGNIPVQWKSEKVVALLDPGAECIVYENDIPSQGIDWAHRVYDLSGKKENIELIIESYGANPNVSVHGRPKSPSDAPYTIGENVLAIFDEELFALYYDFKLAVDLMKSLPENEPRKAQLMWILNEVVNLCIDNFLPYTSYTQIEQFEWLRGSVAIESDTLSPLPTREEKLKQNTAIKAARKLIKDSFNIPSSERAHTVSVMGHAHIDTAWLWPLWVTHRKCAHTFSTAIKYMDQFPDYKFLCSQAAQYDWIKNEHPELFEKIKQKVNSGQWEPTGSMWVEADCNLASGESLVRQFLYGKRFFQKEFGVETKDMFLPDVFGYAASLPQILRKCKIDYFLTQKISWNQTNKFPHHSFLWQGIDGSKVLTHFPPADTYNAQMTAAELRYNVTNYKEHDRSSHSLYLYGHGDGGGGPTLEMLENLSRVKNIEGLPKVRSEFLGDFFENLVSDYWEGKPTDKKDDLQPPYLSMQVKRDIPVWAGELYLELHRGTYTSQAKNKLFNRKLEMQLRDVEFLWSVIPGGLESYPQEEIEKAWKIVLLNQFHDIIPGSSIAEVYRDSTKDYSEAFKITDKLLDQAMTKLAESIDSSGLSHPQLVVNNHEIGDRAHSFSCGDLSDEEKQFILDGQKHNFEHPMVQESEGQIIAWVMEHRPPSYGWYVTDPIKDAILETADSVSVTENTIQNKTFFIEWDKNGLITRIYDKFADREVLQEGQKTNQFQLFDDRPLFWDAWDIDSYYKENKYDITELESIEIIETGPVRAAVRFTRNFCNSKIIQTLSVRADNNRIEFYTIVEWHEEQKMLKVAFPVAINSSRAAYEIQYGHVERPTHSNTSWDAARFEVCAHKWVDLSEGDYGVALINDCKYGHDIQGNIIRLTLLRAPIAPDPGCDRGTHHFTYVLLPHVGDLYRGQVIEQAYNVNAPILTRPIKEKSSSVLPSSGSFFEFIVRDAHVIIEAVKKAEDEQAIIMRIYEAYNTRGKVTMHTILPVAKAYLCDMLENNLEELEVKQGSIELYFKPFEIHTIKLYLEK